MKLSECWKGRVVQRADLDYDSVLRYHSFGHIVGFYLQNEEIKIKVESPCYFGGTAVFYYYPEDLKPLED